MTIKEARDAVLAARQFRDTLQEKVNLAREELSAMEADLLKANVALDRANRKFNEVVKP